MFPSFISGTSKVESSSGWTSSWTFRGSRARWRTRPDGPASPGTFIIRYAEVRPSAGSWDRADRLDAPAVLVQLGRVEADFFAPPVRTRGELLLRRREPVLPPDGANPGRRTLGERVAGEQAKDRRRSF